MSEASTCDAFARPRPRADAELTDVVCTLSNATWQAAYDRGFFMPEDRLVRSLLASERIGRLLVCNHARSLPVKLARELFGSDRAPFPADERTALIEPVRLRRIDPATLGGVQRDFGRYDRAVARAVRQHGLVDPVVITGHPLVAGFSELTWARTVTWYAIDDWAEHPAYRRWWEAYRAAYQRVRDRQRRVAAVSAELLERLAPTGPALVAPNGIDPAEWTGPAPPAPARMAKLPRPWLVYAGALDSRLDVEWLEQLAQSPVGGTVVLAGPLVEPDHFAGVQGRRGVHFCGSLDRDSVRGLMRSADVGLLPHVSSPLTEAMSPLKLLEYVAAGLPVAATDLRPVRELALPGVVLVPAGGDYRAAAAQALAQGRASEGDRLAVIDANSWRARHELVLDLALA